MSVCVRPRTYRFMGLLEGLVVKVKALAVTRRWRECEFANSCSGLPSAAKHLPAPARNHPKIHAGRNLEHAGTLATASHY